MSDHSSLGASGSRRWMHCLGSINLSEKAPPDKGSVYADAGTAAHEIMERCLKNDVDPVLFLDTVIQTDDMNTPVTVDEEMVEAVQVVRDYVAAAVSAGVKVLGVEVKFDLSPLNPPGPMYGRADIVLQHPGTKPKRFHKDGNLVVVMPKPGMLEVVDLKYGQGTIVNVVENSQLMYYALGAVVATNEIPLRLRSTVIQPRAPHPDGIIRHHEFEYTELKDFKGHLFERAALTQDEDAPLTPGDWCKFCPALAICPAQLEAAQEVAKTEFAMIETSSDEPQLPVPEGLELEELTKIMTAAPVIDAWLKSVMNHVRERTEAGEETGFKLVPKRGRRMWVDADVAERAAVSALGEDAYAPRKLRSVTQMEKALKEKGGSLPEDQWSMVSSGTNLVPDADPRPALPPSKVDAADDFQVQPEALDAYPVGEGVKTHAVEFPGVHAEGVLNVEDEASAVIIDADLAEAEAAVLAGLSVMTPEEVEGLADQPTHYADSQNFTPAEVDQGNHDAIEIEVNTWMVEVEGHDEFFVEANSEAEARNEARVYLGVDRLPNHSRLTPS